MTVEFFISSIVLGFIVPLLVQAFKKVKWNFWGKLGLAIFISAIVGVGNGWLNGAFANPIVDWNTLSAAIVAVFAVGQSFWKLTFESHFSGK